MSTESPHTRPINSLKAAATVSAVATLCAFVPPVVGLGVGAVAGAIEKDATAAERSMEAAKFMMNFGLAVGGTVMGGGMLIDFAMRGRKQDIGAYFTGLAAAPLVVALAALPVREYIGRIEKPKPEPVAADCVEICPLIPPGQPGSHDPAPSLVLKGNQPS